MKYNNIKKANFWLFARKFLHEYMPVIRNLSGESVKTYKQALKDYISFLKKIKSTEEENITFDLFTYPCICDFIKFLKNQNLSNKSINLKITAIRSFLKFCGEEDFELRGLYEESKKIRTLKVEKKPIEYLQENETKAILSAYDGTTLKSRRNRMMMILLYDTGARVQELADLNLSSLHLNAENPYITLVGKGRKTRNVPLLLKTVEHLKIYIKEFHPRNDENPLFYSYLDCTPHRLSTDTISLVLKNAAEIAADKMTAYYTSLMAAFPKGNNFSTEVIAEVWAGIVNAHQDYMRYVSYLNPVIETNVTVERLAVFKKKFYDLSYGFRDILAPMLEVSAEKANKLQVDLLMYASAKASTCYNNPLVQEALKKINIEPGKMDFYRDVKDFILMGIDWAKKAKFSLSS